MKLIEFECPSCGAHLKADASRNVMFCEYCGRKLYVDDEVQHVKITIDNAQAAGYAFEQGRMNAQSETVGELAERIQILSGKLPEYLRLEKKKEQISRKLFDLLAKKGEAEAKKPWGWYFLIGAFIVLMTIYTIEEGDAAGIAYALFAAALLGGLILIRKGKLSLLQERINRVKEEQAQVSSQMEEYARKNGFEIIPDEYRTKDCLAYIRNSLTAGTACNIAQAISGYDSYRMQLTIAEQNRQQLEFQQQQLKEMKEMKEKMKERNNGQGGFATALTVGAAVFTGLSILDDILDD